MILRRLLAQAAAKLANDPRMRAKAVEVLDRDVKPRAVAAWHDTKPKLESVRDELREMAAETNPLKDPLGFAAKLRNSLRDPEGDG